MTNLINCGTCGYPLTPEERTSLIERDGVMVKPAPVQSAERGEPVQVWQAEGYDALMKEMQMVKARNIRQHAEIERLSALVRAQQITIDKLEQALAAPYVASQLVIDMAQEIAAQYNKAERFQTWTHDYLMQRLMELVAVSAATEREACAKVCDEQVERSLAAVEKTKRTTDHRIYRAAAQTATWNAAAIRARGVASTRGNT